MKHKGKKGYVSYLKRFDIIFIVVSALICTFVYCMGLYLWHTNANIATIVSICSLLPACKRVVNLIVIFPYKGISEDDYNQIDSSINKFDLVLCEALFSTEKGVYLFKHMVVTTDKMVVYSTMSKDKNKYLVDYYNKAFKNQGIDVHTSIYDNVTDYIRVVNSLSVDEKPSEETIDYITSVLM